MKNKKNALAWMIGIIAGSGGLVSENTIAQQSEKSDGAVSRLLETVTVTATKKQDVEDVQSVPLSITAFNADTLDALKVRNVQDLTYSAPNVSLDSAGTIQNTANFSIRGLGIQSSIPSIDPTVGVFVDGVYMGNNNGVVVDLFDLDSIEVLRGPQGILFGRNTTGGAVLINTGNPTDELSYKVRASVQGPVDGRRGGNSQIIQGTISGPLVEGKLNGKLGVYYNDDDGYFRNIVLNTNQSRSKTDIIRGALEYTPSEDLTVLAKVELLNAEGNSVANQNLGVVRRGASFDVALEDEGSNEVETLFTSLKVDWDIDFGDGTITNILGYRDFKQDLDTELDALPVPILDVFLDWNQEQISNELRYAGSFGSIDVRTGLYYFNQEIGYDESREVSFVPVPFFGGGFADHTVYGAFANFDFNVSENLILSAGLRYSYEEKDVDITYIRPRAEACSVIDGTCPTTGSNLLNPAAPEPNGFSDKNDWSNVTPKLGVQYLFSDTSRVFFNYTKGFRGGGYNFRITDAAGFETLSQETGTRSFNEEEVDSYELGMKFQSEDGRAVLNAAIFRTEIENLQKSVNVPSEEAGVVQSIINTADATIDGFELEGRYAIMDNLLITANFGVLDAGYDRLLSDLTGDGVIDGADFDLDLARVPDTTYGLGLIHDLDMGGLGALSSRINYQYRDRFSTTDSNLGWVPEVDFVDIDFSWRTPVDGLSVSLFGKNMLDEHAATFSAPLPVGGQFAGTVPGGEDVSTGVAVPYAEQPAIGASYALTRGRVVGIEITFTN